MRNKEAIGILFAAAGLFTLAPLAGAQQDTASKAPAAQQVKKASHEKVWTDDDLTSLRSPADIYREQQQEAAAKAAAAARAAVAKPPAPAKPANHAPPALSNPKTVQSADSMIAWENRDISAQQEYVERLQKELETAPPDQQAHLQDLIKERTQVVADTIKERDGLEAQKSKLEQAQAPAGGPSSSTVQ
ncbi:MAG TPA: hypothetical protein VN661_09265 [Candidatus Acidoferrales bacterium]|nr:hypothetical protein [Candidatus Acidoferrales bacterium]